jgi:PmbA protein
MSRSARYTYTQDELRGFAGSVLAAAKRLGATSCECDVSEGYGLSVSVRKGAVDTIENNRDKGIGVSVYLGERPKARRGHASTSDFSEAAIVRTVEAALAIARHTAEDDCAGPPEPQELASRFPDLDLHHPWDITSEEAIALAKRTEKAAFALSPKLKNSEGAGVSAQHYQFVFANSLGFMGGFPTTQHSTHCVMIAEDKGMMQRDDWYSASRVPGALANPEALGRYAGERALARLGARKIATCQAPVLFEAPLATYLIATFVSAVSGGNLYRKSSFLVDSLGKEVFSKDVTIDEDPFVPRGLASTPFDQEGVATQARAIVRAGVLEG